MTNNAKVAQLIKTHGVYDMINGYYQFNTCYVDPNDGKVKGWDEKPITKAQERDILEAFA